MASEQITEANRCAAELKGAENDAITLMFRDSRAMAEKLKGHCYGQR